jgi:hypothetical protein
VRGGEPVVALLSGADSSVQYGIERAVDYAKQNVEHRVRAQSDQVNHL